MDRLFVRAGGLAIASLLTVACAAVTDSNRPLGSDVRFVAVGDTGKGTAGQQAVADAMARHCAAHLCDFAVLLGDNIYDSGISSPDDPQMQTKFEDVYAALPLDFHVTLGNHDYGGAGLGNEFDRAQNEIDYSARSTKWKLPAAHYTMNKGIIDFFVLDTNLLMYSRQAAQEIDVPAWIAKSQSPWKIALGHHPYRSNGPHGNAGTYDGITLSSELFAGKGVQDFLENFICGQVDVYLAGHDHSMQWLAEPCRGTTLAVAGTGASATYLAGTNPTKFESLELGFLYVVVSERELAASFISTSGAVLHSERLAK